eukprot:scaffold7052_cov254-Pinguiococcus_pyrenoidosus.AAC.58
MLSWRLGVSVASRELTWVLDSATGCERPRAVHRARSESHSHAAGVQGSGQEGVPPHQLALGVHRRGDELPVGKPAGRPRSAVDGSLRRHHLRREEAALPHGPVLESLPRERGGWHAAEHGRRRRRLRGLLGRGEGLPGRELPRPAQDGGPDVRRAPAVRGRSHVLRCAAHEAELGLADLSHHPGARARDQGAGQPRRAAPRYPPAARGAADPGHGSKRGGHGQRAERGRSRAAAAAAGREAGGQERGAQRGDEDISPKLPPDLGPALQGRLPVVAVCQAGGRLRVPVHVQGFQPGGLRLAALPTRHRRGAARERGSKLDE